MPLFDTHCHLDFTEISSQFEALWLRAQHAGVQRALIPSVGAQNWSRVKAMAHQYQGLYYALGFHPQFLDGMDEANWGLLDTYLAYNDVLCVAIGECGLDTTSPTPMAVQEEVLQRQLTLAKAHRKPIILHSRGAHNRMIQLVKQAKLIHGGVIHAFSGSYEQGMEWVRLGFYLGIGGVITYPRARKTRDAVSRLPAERFLLETDAPDMPIYGEQGQANEPKNVRVVLETIAILRSEALQPFALQLWENSNHLFSLNDY
ncbi:TatD family hydrolase [Vibrio agarilyticus]|uniref:TatD family hydrolase n=1 Tax=Vibrio agarilyticus TaxID=2726741 RepID=UPI003F6DE95E